MDYRDNRQRWAESHQAVHFYAGQWCTFTPALTLACPASRFWADHINENYLEDLEHVLGRQVVIVKKNWCSSAHKQKAAKKLGARPNAG